MKIYFALLLTLAVAADAFAQSDSSLFEHNSRVRAWMTQKKVPTLGIGLIDNGKLTQIKVYGELAKGHTAPYNTIFNVASLTKPLTAIITLKLVSMGKWDLDEPLYHYWTDPDIASDPRHKKLTTRIVLTHQTGFLNWRWLSETKKLAFQFDPGTRYQYSGEGFEYLRKALEKKFKKTLSQLADEMVFHPLKMKDSRLSWDKSVDSTRFATGYAADGRPYKTHKDRAANAADDLLTTIEDYGRFLVSIMDTVAISSPVFADMISKQVATTRGKHFALGFERYDLENEQYALSHGGADEGVRTLFFIFPKTKNGLLIMTNSDTGGETFAELVIHYLGSAGQQIVDIETK